jgi:glycosyltransferase involved in cell wall biosynthesis
MTRILSISDQGISSGFGRIAATIEKALVKRGYEVHGASLAYDGLLPPRYDGDLLPYNVAALNPYTAPVPGRPFWTDAVLNLINALQPDIVWVTQDAPYGCAVRNLPLDWSKYAFMVTTPVDGKPIDPEWVEMVKSADAALTISEFGVQAYAEAGVTVGLCRPGIDADKFFPQSVEKRLENRAKAGIPPDAYVHGMMAMNQGRKAITQTLRAFMDFARDKPDARLLMDMEEGSPAGWHIPKLCRQFGWDVQKILFRSQAMARGLTDLNDRYNLLDSHSVLAYREGFGLPVLESMAAGVVSMAVDWCAGTEVLRDGRGILIPAIQVEGEDYFHPSTWGGALDKLPNYHEMTHQLQWLYDNPHERQAMAKRGMEWARLQTWTPAIDAAVKAVENAVARKHKIVSPPVIAELAPTSKAIVPISVINPDGITKVDELVNS